jgi:putative ATP-binding cassette transporter
MLVCYGAFAVLASYTISKLTQTTIHKLRVSLSRKILSANFQNIEKNKAKILPVLTSDLQTFSYSIENLPHVLTGVATVIGCYLYLFWLSWELTSITLCFFLLMIPILKIILPLLSKYSQIARDVWNDLFNQFDGLVNGLKELSLSDKMRSAYIDLLIIPTSKKQNLYNLKENIAGTFSSKIMDIILLLGIGFLLFFIKVTAIVEFKFFGEFLMILLFTIAPLSTASGFLRSFKRTEVALGKINELGIELDQYVEMELVKIENATWNKQRPLIELKEVIHEYESENIDEKFSLGALNFKIYQNEVVFIVGGNGSGKTTLAKVLTGLYTPFKGEIFYKDIEIIESNLTAYRNKFSAIFTDFFLFEDLNHLDEGVVEKQADSIISKLLLTNKVSINDNKLSTLNLSQGQRKRLALLRVLMEDNEIYLFDEWAANQDVHFKSIFYEQILPELRQKGKTVIVISHDDSYFHHAHRLIALKDGSLIEDRRLVDEIASSPILTDGD